MFCGKTYSKRLFFIGDVKLPEGDLEFDGIQSIEIGRLWRFLGISWDFLGTFWEYYGNT